MNSFQNVLRVPLLILLLAVSAGGTTALAATPSSRSSTGIASGAAVNLPLVARLVGAGNTLYISSVDISNNNAVDAEVDFYFDGVDLVNGLPVARNGSISSSGSLVAQGTGGKMRARSNAHFDDFIDAMVKAGMLDTSIETDGFIGSVLFVFDGFTKLGQGAAQVRFYSSFGGGTVSQALKGYEMTVNEPQALVTTLRDSRGKPGPQLYGNLFINNTGITATGTGTATEISVHVQAYANSTGQPTGTPLDTKIGIGQTVGISDALTALHVPAGEDTVLVYVTVSSGTSAIAGVSAQVDQTTRDGSVVLMSRAD